MPKFQTFDIQYLLPDSPAGRLALEAVAEIGLVLMKVALFLPFEVLTAYAGSTVDNTARMPSLVMPTLQNLYCQVLTKNNKEYYNVMLIEG